MKEKNLEAVMNLYTQDLLRLSYYYTNNLHTAQDIVQDVFIKYYQKQIALNETEVKPYLMKMVINKSKDFLKSWHFKKMKFTEKIFINESTTNSNILLQKEEKDDISKAVFELPIKQREAIAYYYFEGLTIKEIASLLNLPESTIKSRLSKGRKQLRESLKTNDWEEIFNG